MNNKPGILKMICYISDYDIWDDIIHENTCRFHDGFSIYPNLILACRITWDRIDEYANLYNPDNIKQNENYVPGEDEQDEEVKSISSFGTSEYSLEFCLDDNLKDDYFILVFDEDPLFDGEPGDPLDTQEICLYKRIA